MSPPSVLRLPRHASTVGLAVSLVSLSLPALAMPDGLALPCGGCHELLGGPTISLNVDASSVDPGATLDLVVTLTVDKADAVRTGLWLTADGGEFQLVEAGTKLDNATSVLHSEPRDLTDGQATFTFSWTAPLETGVIEFVAWSIAGNANGTSRDDPFTRTTFAVAFGCSGRGFFPDADGDGFGDDSARVFTCDAPPQGLIELGGDCDDSTTEVAPGAPELCNLVDDDCNGLLDDGVSPTLLYPDTDGDGFGVNTGNVQLGCGIEGFSPILGDCADTNAAVFPNATELLNGIDDDCDGDVDEAGALPLDVEGDEGAPAGQPPASAGPSASSAGAGCGVGGDPRVWSLAPWLVLTALFRRRRVRRADVSERLLLSSARPRLARTSR